ncbi:MULTISPECIES: endonuclease/exonuclease/phosphatase family protein [Myxococcaceae]|uniref:endonuclease/exonuclease/phosphatase family protein n=1 Tax=Myxococcaceae TaxID=31 RepID=UPI001890AA92|nr:endonuclease/exonuclease/phosphatase family protein [Simulacricoccus sp. 17bor-14]
MLPPPATELTDPAEPTRRTDSVPGLTIATFNLRLNLDEWERRAPLAVEQLARVHPHFIALQEVWLPIAQARWLAGELNARLAAHVELGAYSTFEVPKWGEGGGKEAVAVLSRLPVVGTGHVEMPGGRVAALVRATWRGKGVEVVSTHLHHGPVEVADGMRRSQLRTLFGWLDKRLEEPHSQADVPAVTVLTGDFNTTPDSAAIALLRSRYQSAYLTANGREPEWTYGTAIAMRNDMAHHGRTFRSTLDYIFVTPGVPVRSARIICNEPHPEDPDLTPSDHLGVMAELVVP